MYFPKIMTTYMLDIFRYQHSYMHLRNTTIKAYIWWNNVDH